MPSRRKKQQHSGVVLLLALLVMAAITASTIGLSVFISSTTGQSKNLDDFVIASLSADSGLERSLAVIKAGRQGSSLSNAVGAVNNNLPGGFDSGLLPNKSRFIVTGTEASGALTVPKLETGQSFSFDIIQPAVPFPTALGIAGNSNNGGVLDVSWVVIETNGNTDWSGRWFLREIDYEGLFKINLVDGLRTETSNAAGPFNGSALGYRIRVQAAAGTVENITAMPYEDNTAGSPPTNIPSNVLITSTGQAGATRSIKTASILWQLPTSRLFNFVLFTEGPIVPCGSAEVSC